MVSKEARTATTAPATVSARRLVARGYLFVAMGGIIGALARHGVTEFADTTLGHAAVGTFIANISGAFLLGYFATITAEKIHLPLDVRRFVAIGILGSYTTFSVLSYQTLRLIEDGSLAWAAANSLGSLFAGLVAATAGVWLARGKA